MAGHTDSEIIRLGDPEGIQDHFPVGTGQLHGPVADPHPIKIFQGHAILSQTEWQKLLFQNPAPSLIDFQNRDIFCHQIHACALLLTILPNVCS